MLIGRIPTPLGWDQAEWKIAEADYIAHPLQINLFKGVVQIGGRV